jgi:hypothetical protein
VVYDDGDKQWHSWQGDGAPDWRVDDGKAVEVKEGGKKRKLSGCDEEEQHFLIRSDKSNTGYKGVYPNKGRYSTQCNTPPCHHSHLGRFDTPEEAGQAYLQHWEKKHPEELKKERAPPLQVQGHLLIRSDRNKTGYKGVHSDKGRYQAKCNTPPCRRNHLGTFDTLEEAGQAYLQHYQKEHPEELKKERVPRPVLLPVQEHLLIQSDRKDNKTGFKGVHPHKGRYKAQCSTPACLNSYLGSFGTPEEAAQAYLQHWQTNHPGALEKEQQ